MRSGDKPHDKEWLHVSSLNTADQILCPMSVSHGMDFQHNPERLQALSLPLLNEILKVHLVVHRMLPSTSNLVNSLNKMSFQFQS